MKSDHERPEAEKRALDVAIEYHRALRFELNEMIRFRWHVDSWKFALVIAFFGVFKTTDQFVNIAEFWFLLVVCFTVMDSAIYYRQREIPQIADYICDTIETSIFKPLVNEFNNIQLWEEKQRNGRVSTKGPLFMRKIKYWHSIAFSHSILISLVLSLGFLIAFYSQIGPGIYRRAFLTADEIIELFDKNEVNPYVYKHEDFNKLDKEIVVKRMGDNKVNARILSVKPCYTVFLSAIILLLSPYGAVFLSCIRKPLPTTFNPQKDEQTAGTPS